jgi:CheY-like chemotaxis protein
MSHTIMVIDDNQEEIEIMRRALAKTGRVNEIKTVLCGEAALELMRRKQLTPALIFLDLKMPGMSGIETVRQIRADASLKHIPVIILTNSTLESDKKEALDAGADAFLHKAFDLDQFCRDVKSALECWLKP